MSEQSHQPVQGEGDRAPVPTPPHFMRCQPPRMNQTNEVPGAYPNIEFDVQGKCRIVVDTAQIPLRRFPLTSSQYGLLIVLAVTFLVIFGLAWRLSGSFSLAWKSLGTAAAIVAFAWLWSGPDAFFIVKLLWPSPHVSTVGITIDPRSDSIACEIADVTRPLSSLCAVQVLTGSIDAGTFFPWQVTLIFSSAQGFERVLAFHGHGELDARSLGRLARLGHTLGVPIEFFHLRGWRTPTDEVYLARWVAPKLQRNEARAGAVEPLDPAWDALGRSRFDAFAEPIANVIPEMTCMKCGYEIVGIPAKAVCPECAELIQIVRTTPVAPMPAVSSPAEHVGG